MIYLASPYSHPNSTVREARFQAACRATAEIVHRGIPVFAPVVQGQALVYFGSPGDWMFWQRLARDYLASCDELVVLQLDGWRESQGVQAEMPLAALGKRVDYLEPAEASG